MPEITSLDVTPGTSTERFICGQQGGTFRLALVFKRAYAIAPNGTCRLTDEKIPIEEDAPPWLPDLPSPLASPPRWDPDVFGFKPAVDLVVQGHAYSYYRRATVETEVRVGPYSRVIRVHGERRAQWSSGRVSFTPPEPFEKIPVRYDRAYGGLDAVALRRHGDRLGEGLAVAQPSWADDIARNTPYHYPRNPAGCGYLIEADQESVEAVRIPNLEMASDPVTPERLAVGDVRAWPSAPIPAAYDWVDASWFPRLAYLGFVPLHDKPARPLPEVAMGWAPGEILDLSRGRRPFFDPRFQQGASLGLSVQGLPADAQILLAGLFPSAPEMIVRLPGDQPRVAVAVSATDRKSGQARPTAVVVQPDDSRVIVVYSAAFDVARPYGKHEMAAMGYRIG